MRELHPDWPGLPAMRREAHYGDRVLRCFAERPAGLYAMLETAVARGPARRALSFAGGQLSYGELHVQVEALARSLAAAGVKAGERIMMFMGNRPGFVLALLAIQRIGAIAVPVGIREQQPGLAYMAQKCAAVGIIHDAEIAERVPTPEQVPGMTLRWSDDTLPARVAQGMNLPALPPWQGQPDDVSVILFTSGTTGRPKGAQLTHLSIAHSVRHYELCMHLGSGDTSVLAVPASHVTGLVGVIAVMLHVGGCTVILERFRADEFLAAAARERVTHTIMVPAMYNLCLLQPEFDGQALGAWRIGGYGGAPMPPATIAALARRLPGLTLMNAYGATETSSPAVMMPMGQTANHVDSVGVALPCADVRVMNDQGIELGPGEEGELWIGGAMVVPGYWDDPQATAREFVGGYWRSGDVGSIDSEGYVRVFDRIKDMLNRGGYKIYSVEVENVMASLPGVVEAAVVGRACPVLGERVHAFVHAPGADLTAEAVRGHCARYLADYKVPETVTFTDEPLPRNANGKLMKRLLREA